MSPLPESGGIYEFPKEYVNMGLFNYCNMTDGRLLIIIRWNRYQRINEWSESTLDFLRYAMSHLIKEYVPIRRDGSIPEDKKIIVLCDCSNFPVRQTNMKLGFKILDLVLKYYTEFIDTCYYLGIPRYFRPIASIALKLAPQRIRSHACFIDCMDSFIDEFGSENTPSSFGGSLQLMSLPEPDHGLSVVEFGIKHRITEKSIFQMLEYLEFLAENP